MTIIAADGTDLDLTDEITETIRGSDDPTLGAIAIRVIDLAHRRGGRPWERFKARLFTMQIDPGRFAEEWRDGSNPMTFSELESAIALYQEECNTHTASEVSKTQNIETPPTTGLLPDVYQDIDAVVGGLGPLGVQFIYDAIADTPGHETGADPVGIADRIASLTVEDRAQAMKYLEESANEL